MQREAAREPRRVPGLLAALGLTILLSACGAAASPSPSLGPSPTSPASSSASTPPTASPAASPTATDPGQSDTDWERIWDDVPTGFPTYPAAHPTDTGDGPASAILDAGTAKPAAVVAWYQTALGAAQLSPISKDGPREDGSFELIVGDGACHVRVTAAPLGSSAIVTVMYGASCPFS